MKNGRPVREQVMIPDKGLDGGRAPASVEPAESGVRGANRAGSPQKVKPRVSSANGSTSPTSEKENTADNRTTIKMI